MNQDRMMQPVGRYMTRDVMWTAPDSPLARVLRRMNEERIRHALVVAPAAVEKDNEIPARAMVGILSSRDVLRELEKSPDDGIRLSSFTVHEVMTPTPLSTIGPEDTLAEAARLMLGKRISALPVISEEEVVGMITTDDLLLASSLTETTAD